MTPSKKTTSEQIELINFLNNSQIQFTKIDKNSKKSEITKISLDIIDSFKEPSKLKLRAFILHILQTYKCIMTCRNLENLFKNGDGIKPMLAKKYSDEINPRGYWISEKLDGVRCIYHNNIFKSRTDIVINAPSWFLDKMPKDAILDGELFTKRQDFNHIFSIISKKIPITSEWKEIVYMVYDIPVQPDSFKIRYESLQKIDQNDYIKILPQFKVKSRDDVEKYYTSLVSQGAEGVMLRSDSMYQHKRTLHLLKYKKFLDSEAQVINYKIGTGKYVNMLGGLIVKWCNTDNNFDDSFVVGSGFSDEERKKYTLLFPIGTIITVKYFELSKLGKPRFPIFLRINSGF